jgi:hypothetical protein
MLTTVGRYLDPWEAHILRARLEAEGIPATVSGDRHMIMNWPISIALGGAMLQVPEPYVEQATRVVENYNGGVFEQELIAEFPDAADKCPVCGSKGIAASVPIWRRVVVLITTIVASAPFPAKASKMHCSQCGYNWLYED